MAKLPKACGAGNDRSRFTLQFNNSSHYKQIYHWKKQNYSAAHWVMQRCALLLMNVTRWWDYEVTRSAFEVKKKTNRSTEKKFNILEKICFSDEWRPKQENPKPVCLDLFEKWRTDITQSLWRPVFWLSASDITANKRIFVSVELLQRWSFFQYKALTMHFLQVQQSHASITNSEVISTVKCTLNESHKHN